MILMPAVALAAVGPFAGSLGHARRNTLNSA
jgi:hypothetical protein